MHGFVLLALALAGCHWTTIYYPSDGCDDSGVGDANTDADTDVDADTDTDADTDVDTDADADTGEPGPHYWPWGGDLTVEDANASFVGETPGAWAGGHIAVVGDMNGDGVGDFVIGDPHHSKEGESGKVYIVRGRRSGWTLGEALAPYPSIVGAYRGMCLSKAGPMGDVNGDGLADVGIESGYSTVPPPGGVYLVFGRTGGWRTSVSSEAVDAVAYNEYEGPGTDLDETSYLGDMDGDGLDDWFMSAPSINGGEAMVVSGATASGSLAVPDDASLWIYGGTEERVYFFPTGDVNGDGLADLLGEFDSLWPDDRPSTHTYLFLGRSGALPHDISAADAADTTLWNSAMQGQVTNRVGDIDGDGAEDLWMGVVGTAPATNGGGYLFLGRDPWPATLTEADADLVIESGTGSPASGNVGDLDGDGLDDLAIDPWNGAETVYVGFGRTLWPAEMPLASMEVAIEPAGNFTRLDWKAPEGRGDINGDGVRDLVFSDHSADEGGMAHAGAVAVFVGRTAWPASITTDDADVRFTGSYLGQSMGTSGWFVIGDVNGDSFDDILTSAFQYPVGSEEGETFIFFGQEGP